MAGQLPPFTASGVVDASGNLTIAFTPRANQLNKVTQTAGEMTGASGAICVIRRNGFIVTPCVPTGFAAGGDPPIYLWPTGDYLTVEWTKATPGLIGKVTIFYDIGE